jgi:radical SAM protein with 4Fe4S-binding SPASM domain
MIVRAVVGKVKGNPVADLRSVQLNVTNTCGQRCIMCRKYEWPRHLLPLELVRDVVSGLPTHCTVILSGGEPLMHPSIDGILRVLDNQRVRWALLTNGMVFGEGLSGAAYLNISFDALSPEVYRDVRGVDAGKSVRRNVERYRRAYPHAHIMLDCTVCGLNTDQVPQLMEFAHDLGVEINFQLVHTHSYLVPSRQRIVQLAQRGAEVFGRLEVETNFFIFLEQCMHGHLASSSCCAVDRHCVVDADGSVFPCCRALNDNGLYGARDRRWIMGNVHERALEHIWQSGRASHLRDRLSRREGSFCRICDRYAMYNWFLERYIHAETVFM